MNTSLLRYAVTYAACGSAQKAAERLGVSRSSVTRNIKRLEEELGAPLFIAAPDGVVPTYTGDICLRYAREILNVEEDLSFDLAEDGVYQGSVSIGMGANRAQRVLPVVLPEFHRRYPGISVQLYELSTADISIGLMNQRLDFAVVGQSHTTSGISFEPLMTERLVLVAPKEDSFARDHSYQLGGSPQYGWRTSPKSSLFWAFPTKKAGWYPTGSSKVSLWMSKSSFRPSTVSRLPCLPITAWLTPWFPRAAPLSGKTISPTTTWPLSWMQSGSSALPRWTSIRSPTPPGTCAI